jgi:hypothetical protein
MKKPRSGGYLAIRSDKFCFSSVFTSFLIARLLGAMLQLSDAEGSSRMKKVPLFEYEIPLYRKRPIDWAEQKPTR